MEQKSYKQLEDKVNKILRGMKYSDGKSEVSVEHHLVTKIQTDEYLGQDKVIVKIFLRSSGSKGNNNPLQFKSEVTKGFANKFKEDLNALRKNYDPLMEEYENAQCDFCGSYDCDGNSCNNEDN